MRAKDDPIQFAPAGGQAKPAAGGQAKPGGRRAGAAAGGQAKPGGRRAGAAAGRGLDGGKPLLLVDIDGVISLFSFDRDERPEGRFHSIDGIPHFLSSAAAEHLLALSELFELVWASGWEEKANEYLPHLLGLPELPYLSFERSVGMENAHWKLDAIDAHACGRPLAWIDDAFNDACHAWARAREAPTLLVQTTPAKGLTRRELETLRRWSRSLARA